MFTIFVLGFMEYVMPIVEYLWIIESSSILNMLNFFENTLCL